MSKIQTLKLASDYIGFLYTVLREGEEDQRYQNLNGGNGTDGTGNGSAADKNLSYYFNMWRMQDFLKWHFLFFYTVFNSVLFQKTVQKLLSILILNIFTPKREIQM